MALGASLGLLASVLWAMSSLLATRAVRYFGSMYYNCLRLLAGTVLLACVAVSVGSLHMPSARHAVLIAGSSIIGLTLGDLLLFRGFGILGPRRATLVFMLNIPMTAALGFVLFGERLTWQQGVGTLLALLGMVLATAVGRSTPGSGAVTKDDTTEGAVQDIAKTLASKTDRRSLDDMQGPFVLGVIACLLAALCQSIGLVMLKPIAAENPYSMPQFAMMRFGVAALFALMLLWQRDRQTFAQGLDTIRRADRIILLSALGAVILGSVLGFICYMGAIVYLPAAMAALLTSLSPLFVLPMLVVYARQVPPLHAWTGALLGCAGIWLTLAP